MCVGTDRSYKIRTGLNIRPSSSTRSSMLLSAYAERLCFNLHKLPHHPLISGVLFSPQLSVSGTSKNHRHYLRCRAFVLSPIKVFSSCVMAKLFFIIIGITSQDLKKIKLRYKTMANGKPGAPKGTVNNPKGKNQYVSEKGLGEKDSRIQLVLSAEHKRIFKEAAKKQGMSLSSWMVEAALKAAES